MKKLQFEAESIDIPTMKQSQFNMEINKVPNRVYIELMDYAFTKANIKIFNSHEQRVKRIERFPKLIRDQYTKETSYSDSYRYTGFINQSSEEVSYITKVHPLYSLAKKLLVKTSDHFAFKRYLLSYNVPEHLEVDVYRLVYKDGLGKELKNQLFFMAKRMDDSVIQLASYWLSQELFSSEITELPFKEQTFLQTSALQLAIVEKNNIEKTRTTQLNKMHDYLVDTFQQQYNDVLERLLQYQIDNQDNKNAILINQMNAQLIDIEEQKNKRLEMINRQRTVTLQPPKKIAQFELIPNGNSYRVLATEYLKRIDTYEKSNGRKLMKSYGNLGLVDFYSERFNGEERFIILTDQPNFIISNNHLEDLHNILDKTYVYILQDCKIEEVKLKSSIL